MLATEAFLCTPEMQALLGEQGWVQAVMDFEAALVRAQARQGLIPPAAAQAIASLCRAELYDVAALVAASGREGGLAPPLVRRLRENVALFDPQAAAWVHWGCSDQDALDTALLLQIRRALGLIEEGVLGLVGRLLDLAEQHPATPLLARCELQPAGPSSLRQRLHQSCAPLLRSAQALRQQAGQALLLQLGGPGGGLGAMGESGAAVAAAMAAELRLGLPDGAWHTQRDRGVRLATELALLSTELAKLARGWMLLAQPELDELRLDPADAAPGSARPPPGLAACMQALGAARRAPQRLASLLSCGQDQSLEGGLGSWQGELVEWAGLLQGCHAGLRALNQAAAALHLQPRRMRENLLAQRGLVFAEALSLSLARSLGADPAQRLLQGWSRQVREQGADLQTLVLGWREQERLPGPVPGPDELRALFDPDAAARRADERVAAGLAGLRAAWAGLMDQPCAHYATH